MCYRYVLQTTHTHHSLIDTGTPCRILPEAYTYHQTVVVTTVTPALPSQWNRSRCDLEIFSRNSSKTLRLPSYQVKAMGLKSGGNIMSSSFSKPTWGLAPYFPGRLSMLFLSSELARWRLPIVYFWMPSFVHWRLSHLVDSCWVEFMSCCTFMTEHLGYHPSGSSPVSPARERHFHPTDAPSLPIKSVLHAQYCVVQSGISMGRDG